MKVQVRYTVEVDDDTRRAINRYYGKPGFASRENVRDWFRDHGEDNGNHLLADQMQESAWDGEA